MPIWVDESGDFDDPLDTVVVAGVVVPDKVGNGPVKAALRKLLPGWPWPLHASHLRNEVSLALASAAARRVDPMVKSPIDSDADVAIAALNDTDRSLVESALDELEAGRHPTYSTVARLNVALKIAANDGRLSQEVLARLQIARDEWARAMMQTTSALPSSYGVATVESEQGAGGRSYLRKAGSAGNLSASATHRYLGLLGPTLTNAASIRHVEDAQPLIPKVASRWVHGVRGLGDDDLNRVCRVYGGGAATKLASPQVVRYDRAAPALLVIADFVVNTTRRLVMAGETPLESALLAATGLPFESVADEQRASHVYRVGDHL